MTPRHTQAWSIFLSGRSDQHFGISALIVSACPIGIAGKNARIHCVPMFGTTLSPRERLVRGWLGLSLLFGNRRRRAFGQVYRRVPVRSASDATY